MHRPCEKAEKITELTGETPVLRKMDESDRKKLLVAASVALLAAIVVGALFGLVAGAWRIGFGWPLLPAGLAAGVALRLFGVPCNRVTFLSAMLCMSAGLAVHIGVCWLVRPEWTAKQEVRSEE